MAPTLTPRSPWRDVDVLVTDSDDPALADALSRDAVTLLAAARE